MNFWLLDLNFIACLLCGASLVLLIHLWDHRHHMVPGSGIAVITGFAAFVLSSPFVLGGAAKVAVPLPWNVIFGASIFALLGHTLILMGLKKKVK